ncbi:DNA phosphorothioation-dependent restriction protein DptH [Methylomonas fluvii]|uniref:DNA phosphorothioation-dependent restriction protein DptH n=1 Tax=Methylomonas fluvii TaxID=1854564 RepID=A0ABR9D9L2_9GAMM|nr:DNA phosphorothioation-dependent restriction protein DptH [Methylomonas fluvii]MBD9358958.1 DNA phosphorothioation-dependent restriction protein DptH [Methylomonas fluvii]CAD6871624.1 DNA phosphorothioation-dependent restriction protein DptH / AAA-like domain [Methylomonas fluvii]
MSKQPFNELLIHNLVAWLDTCIQPGYRYRFYSDDEDQLRALLTALNAANASELSYLGTTLPYIDVADTRLVYVNDVEDAMNEHFISNLRDAVSRPDEIFSNCALLVLHQSRLDTLLNSAHDLAAPGAPLNSQDVEKQLVALCKTTSKPKLFQALLDMQTKQIVMENQSAFGYQDIYDSIANDHVDFQSLNLFEDKDLYKFDDRDKIQKRIEENQKLYTDIEYNIRNFANELPERLPKYSPEFIKERLTIDEWENTTLQQLQKEIDKNKGEAISYDTSEAITTEPYFMRDDSTTAAGQRNKNIILFAEGDYASLLFKFKGDGLKIDNFSIMDNPELAKQVSMTYMHRKLDIQVPFDGKPLFFRVRLQTTKSAETHFFKILILLKNSFVLDGIKNYFIIKPKDKELLLKLDSFDLNFSSEPNGPIYELPADAEQASVIEYPRLNISKFYDAHDEVKFAITNGTDSLMLALENEKIEDKISLPLLFNTQRSDRLFTQSGNAEYNEAKKKAILGNREFLLVGDRNTYVAYEHQLVTHQAYQLTYGSHAHYTKLQSIDQNIAASYHALLSYFQANKTTPSLCAWDEEVCMLATMFVGHYLSYVSNIEEDQALSTEQKTLFELGFVRDKGKTYLSPFSPLVLAYILHLVKRASNPEDDSYQHLFAVTLKRLNAKGLFPYLFINNETYAYTQVIEEDPFWLEFVPNEENEYSYVSKLTAEKIREFKEAFSALFDFRNEAPLIINSINNGRNEEIFEGIVQFYKNSFIEPVKMVVNLYDEHFEETAFDRFADMDFNTDIKLKYRLKEDDADSIIDAMRTHITYSKHLTNEAQNYCHLSFFKNNEKVQIRNRNVHTKQSGLVYEGLISGESSEKIDEHYYSGFGLKNVNIEDLANLKLAKIYNAMQRPVYESGSPYVKDNTIALMISDNFKALLEKSYSSALWTVIIDPKVTLDFFDSYKDLILIHYSDQYSSSASYDAITVTAKSDLYSSIVGSKDIISEFNAFNGEWLIKMITEREIIKKEKNGIIAAYKYITAYLSSPKITWVPLSVAEMIRVSGNVGLSMSKSDFSRYNESMSNDALKLGPISDDILLVGFCDEGVVLYPVEVKSGSADMQKAMQQAQALKSYFYDHIFNGDNLKSRLLKGLFIRQVFMQVEKYQLYNVFDANYFDDLYAKRELLLEGTYSLVEFENHSKGAVVAFLDIQLDTSINIKENILECKLPYDFLSGMLHTPFNHLKEKLHNEEYGTKKSYMLEEVIYTGSTNEVALPKEALEIEVIEDIEPTVAEELPESTIVPPISTGPMCIKFGSHSHTKEDILWYPTDTSKTFNTNTGIIGTMGTGKTQFTKSLIAQMIQTSQDNVNSTPIDILIFNYKAKDYLDEKFVATTNAKAYEPYHLPFNPLSLFGSRPLLPVHTANLFKTTLAKAFGLGTVQQSNLNRIILEAYERRGITKADKSTWTKPAPTIKDLWEVYSNEEKVAFDSLYAALEKLNSFEIFEPDPTKTIPLFEMLNGVTVINIAGYDTDIQNLIVAITLDIFYSQMQIKGASKQRDGYREITKIILVDEADNFMFQDFESLKKILKEGREFGVGTILSTQLLSHFKTAENDYADYILSWIIHKVDKIKFQDINSVFNVSSKQEAESLMDQIRTLNEHYSIYVDGNKNKLYMRDYPFFELMEKNKHGSVGLMRQIRKLEKHYSVL